LGINKLGTGTFVAEITFPRKENIKKGAKTDLMIM
jgi:hypothetical protein